MTTPIEALYLCDIAENITSLAKLLTVFVNAIILFLVLAITINIVDSDDKSKGRIRRGLILMPFLCVLSFALILVPEEETTCKIIENYFTEQRNA